MFGKFFNKSQVHSLVRQEKSQVHSLSDKKNLPQYVGPQPKPIHNSLFPLDTHRKSNVLSFIGYRMRWAIEIFHKEIKMFLGFEDVATKWFDSVIAHVHWVYCAYILMNTGPFDSQLRAIAEKQHRISKIISTREKSRIIQMLTQINGIQRYKNELQQVIASM